MEAPNRNPFLHLLVFALAFAVVVFGPVAQEREARAEDAGKPPRETGVCLDCHDEFEGSLAASPHRVAAALSDGEEARVACTDCHVGDSRHYEDDPEEYPMGTPGEMGTSGEAGICSACHQNSHQQNMQERNVHFDNDVGCSECHRIHGASGPGLLSSPETELCISCHPGVEGQFAQPYRHPVSDGIVKCSECHLALDLSATELSWNGTNSACVRCHIEFEGPFPYEHQATLDYSTDEGGCLGCHAAHGSAQPRMLTQPYEPPHFQLCTQCHSVPPLHNLNTQHGTMWAGIACHECHSDIHGSYTSRNFLSQSLEGQGCLNAGCHQ